MSAFMAGFSRGATEALTAAVARKERREEFMAEQLERRKSTVLPQLMERLANRRAKIANTLDMVDRFQDLGFSRETALVLHASGQLDSELARLEKLGPGKVSTTYKKSLENIAEKYARDNPDKHAKIVSFGLQLQPTTPDQELEALMKVMEATNNEELIQAGADLVNLSQPETIPSIAKFKYNPEKSVALTSVERDRMEKQIINGLAGILDPQYFDNTGEYRIPKGAEVSNLTSKLLTAAQDIAQRSYGLHSEKNSAAAIDYVLDRVRDPLIEGMPLAPLFELTPSGNTQLDQALIDDTYEFIWDRNNPRTIPLNPPPTFKP